MSDLDGDAFKVHRRIVRDDVEIAFVHENPGGLPLLLLHGWPDSKRLFWRNIAPLAAMGFAVVVPDQRGFGDTPVHGILDIVTSARDMHALMQSLGYERCIVAAGDMGSAVALDMSLRFPGFVHRQLIYNGITPSRPDEYEAAGLPRTQGEGVFARSDHMISHGLHADELAASLDTPEKRIDYIEGFLRGRVWRKGGPVGNLGAPGKFDADSARFQAEPLADAEKFRASLGFYEGLVGGREKRTERPLLDQRITVETMILWGMADEIITETFPLQLAVACDRPVGPYIIAQAGHFLQWEAAATLNESLRVFCRDLLPGEAPEPERSV